MKRAPPYPIDDFFRLLSGFIRAAAIVLLTLPCISAIAGQGCGEATFSLSSRTLHVPCLSVHDGEQITTLAGASLRQQGDRNFELVQADEHKVRHADIQNVQVVATNVHIPVVLVTTTLPNSCYSNTPTVKTVMTGTDIQIDVWIHAPNMNAMVLCMQATRSVVYPIAMNEHIGKFAVGVHTYSLNVNGVTSTFVACRPGYTETSRYTCN